MRTVPSALLLIALASGLPALAQSGASSRPASPIIYSSSLGSTYVPMDSWVYPALDRRLKAQGR